MQGFWLTFTDGSKGYCQGVNEYDAKVIAEKLTGKKVAGGAAIPEDQRPEEVYYGTTSWAHDAYNAMVKAAPPASVLLGVKEESNE